MKEVFASEMIRCVPGGGVNIFRTDRCFRGVVDEVNLMNVSLIKVNFFIK